jgi:Fibronectin type III-like domain
MSSSRPLWLAAGCRAAPPAVGTASPRQEPPSATARADTLAMGRFLDSLLTRMTLEEKLGQLNQPGGPDNNTGPAAAARVRGFQGVADSIIVSVEVSNTGRVTGDEVVQLYLRDDVATITRPVKELRGFRRISLEPGESRNVAFVLHSSDLSFYGPDLRRTVEPGTFTVFVGTSSAVVREAHFELVE